MHLAPHARFTWFCLQVLAPLNPDERSLALWLTIWDMHIKVYYGIDRSHGVLADVPAPVRVPGGSRIFAFRTLQHCREMCVDTGDKGAGWEGWTLLSRVEDLWSRGSWALGSSQCNGREVGGLPRLPLDRKSLCTKQVSALSCGLDYQKGKFPSHPFSKFKALLHFLELPSSTQFPPYRGAPPLPHSCQLSMRWPWGLGSLFERRRALKFH